MDLFNNHQNQPKELKKVLKKWADKFSNGLSYKDCKKLLTEVEEIGFTFEYELSAEPFNLKPRKTKNNWIHTPEQSEINFNKIKRATNKNWICSSYKNDETDSIHLTVKETETEHTYFEVYLPNGTEFNQFFLTDENNSELLLTEDINVLNEFIRTNL